MRTVKVFCTSMKDISTSKEKQDIRDKAWNIILNSSIELIQGGTFEILLRVIKSLMELTLKCRECVFKKFEDTWKIFNEFMSWVGVEKHEGAAGLANFSRPASSKIIPAVIDCLKKIFTVENATSYPNINEIKIQNGVYTLIKKLLLTTKKLSEGFQAISTPQKLLSEERPIFEFIEDFPTIFTEEVHYENYIQFLQTFLVFKVEDPHSDALIRRTMLIIRRLISKCKIIY